MQKNDISYLNLSLENIKGEIWKDVPGFDGEYEVSNFGRIKSLRRWRGCGNKGGGYFTKEIIRKITGATSKNKLTQDSTYSLSVDLKSSDNSTARQVNKYVYNAFVSPIDLDDKEIIISHKDGNGRNLHYNNLIISNRSECHKRSYKLKRSVGFLRIRVPIRQYTLGLEEVALYTSIVEASRSTGFTASGIYACVTGHIYQHNGFIWKNASSKIKLSKKKTDPADIFNKYLWEKLCRPETSQINPIPALNLSEKSIKGERWKPIAGIEDDYMISSFGRIKGLPRLKKGKLNTWSKGGLKKLIGDGNDKRPVSCLLAQLSRDGKKFQQSAARLVYYHFVKEFNLSDKSIRIGYKNGYCYDLNWRNLFIQGSGPTSLHSNKTPKRPHGK